MMHWLKPFQGNKFMLEKQLPPIPRRWVNEFEKDGINEEKRYYDATGNIVFHTGA
jgi:hypothetical protein